ncbi:MAG: histidine phosphatase family protein [Planctomycetes bacterium]|nr:histidine phosphatase family protein [Planctomycetota bacterium]
MRTLYFMRHAQSEANLKNILASRKDFPLTEKGEVDAAKIAEEFAQNAKLERVVSSPLKRAQQTAAAFAKVFNLKLQIEERLTEQDLGRFSGMTYEQINNEPNYVHDRSKRWRWEPDGGGESYEMIARRIKPFFQSLDTFEGQSILFVTHAVTLRMIKCLLRQTQPEYPLEIAQNGEIWKVEFKGLGQVHPMDSLFLGDSKDNQSRA